MKIKVNDLVKITSTDTVGKVLRVYDDIDVAIVKCNDGNTSKVFFDDLVKVSQSDRESVPPEGAKKIAYYDFIDAICESSDTHNIMTALERLVILVSKEVRKNGFNLANMLFKDCAEIMLTESQLDHKIIDMTWNDDLDRDVVAIISHVILKGTVKTIFNENSDND